jgi:hypothetical protein
MSFSTVLGGAEADEIRRCFGIQITSYRCQLMHMKLVKLLSALALCSFMAVPAMAQQLPGKHPGYLHALTDLRTARWFLNHQAGDARVYAGEDVAIREIDAAIGEIKRASVDDGKDLNDHPAVDTSEHGSRLLKAIETLKKAHADIDHEEDNPEAHELRHRAAEHIERATHAAEQAHAEWLREKR